MSTRPVFTCPACGATYASVWSAEACCDPIYDDIDN